MQPHYELRGHAPSDNQILHRVWSSSAAFQKGLYHLFLLNRGSDVDNYAGVLRTYQAIFFIAETGPNEILALVA